jgi:hypothetical protein
MSTVSDTLTLLEAFIVGAVAGSTISPRYECRILDRDLPTFIVLPQGGTSEREGFGNYNTSRPYAIVMLIEKVPSDKKQAQQEARERAYQYLDTIPDYFVANPKLEDHTTGIVVTSTLPTEQGAQLTVWNEDTFVGIEFRITVTTSKEVV